MHQPDRARIGLWVFASLMLGSTAVAQPPPPPFPPVPFPPQNPLTEQKRVLGKILFWDEQLSSDNTVACGTCHRAEVGGADVRNLRQPGIDTILNTPDDGFGSPGTIRSDSLNRYLPSTVFGLTPQVTPRAANPSINAMFAPDIFWDGRARTTFTNPQTGLVSIPNGGGLESQAVGPILNSVEMGHDGRTWTEVINKLQVVRPLILASNVPADMLAALAANPSYPDLFAAAYGDPAITAERIAFAIATYERTLAANDTPWDRFNAGNTAALTPNQVNGLNTLRASPCFVCHAPPLFTNNTFQNLGLRPVAEDIGRQAVTGNAANRGQFKVPTLRNVGLKRTFMHTGVFTDLNQVLAFYANGAAQFPDNRSPLLPIALPIPARPAVVDFLANGLTDARVANRQFPFDRPTLFSESPFRNPSIVGAGAPGTGGIVPAIIAVSPPNVGNIDFKVGLAAALGGATAQLQFSTSPPVGGQLVTPTLIGPIALGGSGAGAGFGTWQWPIGEAEIASCDVYLRFQITDPGAAGGIALTPIAHLRMIPYQCFGDMNCDGAINGIDIAAFTQAVLDPAGYAAAFPNCDLSRGDFNGDNAVNANDSAALVAALLGN